MEGIHPNSTCQVNLTPKVSKFGSVPNQYQGTLLQVEIYTGKAPSVEQTAVRKEFGLGYDVVSRLTEQYQYKCHAIYYDRYFSSVSLAEMLLARQTYCCCTGHLNRKGLPVEAKKTNCCFRRGCGIPERQLASSRL